MGVSTDHSDHFPNDAVAGLPPASAPEVVELADGDRFVLTIAPVIKRIGDATVRMLAYNGSIPGPVLKVAQGSSVVVDAVNHGDLEATVHWHGLRLSRHMSRLRSLGRAFCSCTARSSSVAQETSSTCPFRRAGASAPES
ncbi:MAG TPA: multicopper oxidase domain-containing protein [Solirubrobacteraceae bacterium]|nr:multicopper oxidase domain-containing protein [Solirubrobacteraceae bacterium]